MTRPVTFTVYANCHARDGVPLEASWDDWVSKFSKHEVRGSPADTSSKAALDKAKDGIAVVLGEIPKGHTRKGAHVTAVHAIGIDIDNVEEERAEAALKALIPYEHALWTTHKSGSEVAEGKPRLRIILPLAKPLEPEKHGAVWAAVNAMVGGVNDAATKDIGRLHYLPSTFDAQHGFALHHRGMWLALEDLTSYMMVAPTKMPGNPHGGVGPRAIDRIRHTLRSIPKSDPLKGATLALADGAIFAEQGKRHQAIVDLTWRVAEKWPGLSDENVMDLFAPSCTAMKMLDPGAPDLVEAVAAYRGALEKIAEWKIAEKAEASDKAREVQLQQAEEGAGAYTEDDLKRIAATQQWGSHFDLKDKWIIQMSGSGWILGGDGEYKGPFSKDDLGVEASRLLARSPVPLVEATKNGWRWRATPDLVKACGQIGYKAVADLAVQRTLFDPHSRVIREAVCPYRNIIRPRFDERIDGWLRVLSGELYPRMIDWLSCAPDLSKLLCAIYLDGYPGAGKTLLAHGLAKLWTAGAPTDIKVLLSDFNADLARCPLVLADEEIPRNFGRESATAVLRSAISTKQRSLKRKYLPEAELWGAVRIILAANNEFLLDSKEVTSAQDLEAIAQRFFYIKVPQDAAELLMRISREEKEQWAREGIASHAMWLMQNHTVANPGRRFWVEGDVSQMHRVLVTGTRFNSYVCEWLVRYTMNPTPFNQKATGLVRFAGGRLFVNEQAIIDGWDDYLKTRTEPETARVASALRAISKDGRKVRMQWQGRRQRYWEIDANHLCAWSDRNGVGDRDVILAALKKSEGIVLDENGGEDLSSVPAVNEELPY